MCDVTIGQPDSTLSAMARIPSPRHLLIVEDHPDVAESLALILRCDDAHLVKPVQPSVLRSMLGARVPSMSSV